MFLTVKIFAATQLFCCIAFGNTHHSPLEKYVDQWNNAYFLSAKTAAKASILYKEEKLAVHILNLVRYSPGLFTAQVIMPLTPNGYSPELESPIIKMNSISILKFIYPLLKKLQPTQQQNTNNSKKQQAEMSLEALNSILGSLHNNHPVQLIIKLLIAAKDNLKTAGNFCLANHYIPVSLQSIAGGYTSTLRFETGAGEKKSDTATTNKKFKNHWGGEPELWGNNLTDGYNLTKTGQELYKDNDTRAIEKLVIPWLLHFTNTYRKENGLDTLKYDTCLLKAAAYQTDYLFNESKKNHEFKLEHTQNPHSEWFKGESPSDRALAAGCTRYCGENALYTTVPTISLDKIKNRQILNLKAKKIARNMVYDQWHNSKGHRENMLTAGYTCMGVSVVIGKHYQDDADINNSSERTSQKNIDSIGWIAFGIQVMAY